MEAIGVVGANNHEAKKRMTLFVLLNHIQATLIIYTNKCDRLRQQHQDERVPMAVKTAKARTPAIIIFEVNIS
jgi:GTP-binding protein EngB required for normal cell division